MITIPVKKFLLILLVTFAGIGNAQKKGIIISESLAASSEPLKVKLGTQRMGKIWKIKFGDYGVTDSKMQLILAAATSSLIQLKN